MLISFNLVISHLGDDLKEKNFREGKCALRHSLQHLL